ELDLFDQDHFLIAPGFARSFLLLILVFPEVHDPANRRHGRRRDFHQVEPFLSRNGQSLRRRHDAELLPVVVDDADFPNSDSFVDSYAVVSARPSVECDNCLPYEVRCSTSVRARSMNWATGCAPRSPPLRGRTDTVPSAASRSPTTSM